MLGGIVGGFVLTFVTVASELSSTVVLYSGPWTTMTVAMFQALEGTSEWGLDMDVDFDAFERLEVFIRGDDIGKRYLRRWYRPWYLEEVKVPIYRRFVWLIGSIPYEWWPLVRDRVAAGLVDGMLDPSEEWHSTWLAPGSST